MVVYLVKSLRSSERGLKFTGIGDNAALMVVAPFVGAWIEIICMGYSAYETTSLRSSERGLK